MRDPPVDTVNHQIIQICEANAGLPRLDTVPSSNGVEAYTPQTRFTLFSAFLPLLELRCSCLYISYVVSSLTVAVKSGSASDLRRDVFLAFEAIRQST